jgi:anaerobic selenocysteine-containing dehydrogenase
MPVLVRGKDTCFAQIHPDDAARLGLADGSVAAALGGGRRRVPVQVTDVVMPESSASRTVGPRPSGHTPMVAAGHAGVNVNA